MSAVPSFEEAQQDLASFLQSQGHPTQLTWVFREDIHRLLRPHGKALVDAGQRAPPLIAVRLPIPVTNPQVAQALFERARDRGLGVNLVALFRLGPQVACFVWGPRDEDEGMAAMLPPGELKLSIRDPLEDAVPRRSRTRWALSTLRSRIQGVAPWEHIPSRMEAAEHALAQRSLTSLPASPNRTK